MFVKKYVNLMLLCKSDNKGDNILNLNILIAGVGGQGTLLASRILGTYASLKKYDCKLSEVHGMAQRGGSVVTYVKFGEKVYSPVIADGDADVLLAFEELEASRWAYMVKDNGKIIVNNQQIMPLPVITGSIEYPKDTIANLKNSSKTVIPVEALNIAESCGNKKTVNTVMIGVLTSIMGLDIKTMQKAIELSVPKKVLDVNMLAFQSTLK